MTRPLVAAAIAAVLISGCATRGDVDRLRREIAGVSAGLTALQVEQIGIGDVSALRDEVKTLSAEVVVLESKLADSVVQLSQLQKRLDATERTVRENARAVETLKTTVAALPASPPAPPIRVVPGPSDTSVTTKPLPGPEQAYAAALAVFRAREHGQAVLDFLDFLAKYPRHALAPNAQYWIGEAYYAQRDYRQAIVEFQKVFEHGLGNGKVPDALLKIGLCYRNVRDATRASEVWQRVIREHPKSDAAAKARALLRTARGDSKPR